MINCDAVNEIMGRVKQCIDLRIQFLYGCALGGGGACDPNAKTPENICFHAEQICSRVAGWEVSREKAKAIPCDGYNFSTGAYYQFCRDWQKVCNNQPRFHSSF